MTEMKESVKGKFTPGPWRVGVRQHDQMLTVESDDGWVVAAVYDRDDLGKGHARLIAAAPALYAACKAVLDGLRYEKGRPVMAEWRMKEVLEAALAQAEGGGA